MKKRKTIKRLVSLLLAIVLLCTLVMSASAAGTYVGVDDDDAQGHSNSSVGTWTKVYSDNLYYGEALRTSCTSSSPQKEYNWIFRNSVNGYGTVGITLSVWLYHSSFTDPQASYYAKVSNLYSVRCGQVNQNTARAGWTDFTLKQWVSFFPNNSNGVAGIRLIPSVFPIV